MQSQREQAFAERLYRYNSRLYSSRRTKVATLAILCDSAPSWRPTQFAYNLLGCHVQLDFPTAKLLDYQAEAGALAASDNPFAIVTLAHLDALATKADDPARKTAKFRLVRLLYDRGYEREDVENLFRFIDWVLWLDPDLEEQFEEELEAFEKERNMEYISTLERKAIERGLEQGLEKGLEQGVTKGRDEGIVLGQQRMLLMLLTQKFGALPDEFVLRIQGMTDERTLQSLVGQVLSAESLDEMDIPDVPVE